MPKKFQGEDWLMSVTGKAVGCIKLTCGNLEIKEKNCRVAELKDSQCLIREVIGLIQ